MSSYQSLIYVLPHSSGGRCETPDISVQNVTGKNVRDILSFQPASYLETFCQFLENGDEGFYAYLGGQCCHRSWFQKGPQWIQLNPWTQMWLKEGEGYVHYCETAPWARGRGIYPAVLNHISASYPDIKLLISVEVSNIPSIKGIERVGFKKVSQVRVYHVGPVPIFWQISGHHENNRYSIGSFFLRRLWGKLCRFANGKIDKTQKDRKECSDDITK